MNEAFHKCYFDYNNTTPIEIINYINNITKVRGNIFVDISKICLSSTRQIFHNFWKTCNRAEIFTKYPT